MSERKFRKQVISVVLIHEIGNEDITVFNAESVSHQLNLLTACEKVVIETDLLREETLTIEQAAECLDNLGVGLDNLDIKKTVTFE